MAGATYPAPITEPPRVRASELGTPGGMNERTRLLGAGLALVLVLGGATGCGDDPGEDRIGDGEINDEGD